MKRSKKHPRMQKWIWQLRDNPVNFKKYFGVGPPSFKVKRFLAFVWWSGDRGCREWDFQLQKRFGKSRATIQRWIKQLKDLHLVNVQFPSTKRRTIYRMPYFSKDMWLYKSGIISRPPKVSKVRHTYNAKHKKSYKTSFSHATTEPHKVPAARSVVSGAEKLGDVLSRRGHPSEPPRVVQSDKVNPQTQTDIREMKYRYHVKIFLALGYPQDRAHRLATQRATETTNRSLRIAQEAKSQANQ